MSPRSDDDEVSAATVRVGRTLRGKWRLDALIDVGGMAAVYAATHRNGMRGAVKMLHHHASANREAKARFLREGYIANKIAHPNAVRVLDDDVDEEGNVFVVMDLLSGATLEGCARAAGGTLAPDDLLLVVDQLLDVLGAAHDLGIVHRDIKPENVFLTTEGQVKILDFGIARMREPSDNPRSSTVAGLLMGSPAYMAPEQARGRWDLVEARSDLWSVGAMMFSLLLGQPVHPQETLPELLAAVIGTPVRSLATALPGAHPALVQVVDRALQMSPANRWRDARAMQMAVRAAYMAISGAPLPSASLAVRKPDRAGETEAAPPFAPTVALHASAISSRRTPGAKRMTSALVLGSLAVATATTPPVRSTASAQATGAAQAAPIGGVSPRSPASTAMPIPVGNRNPVLAPGTTPPMLSTENELASRLDGQD